MKWNLVPCKQLLNLTTKAQFTVGNIDKLNLIRIKDFFQRVSRLKKKFNFYTTDYYPSTKTEQLLQMYLNG